MLPDATEWARAARRLVPFLLALGGVAPKPWRAYEAENVLSGAEASMESFRRAAEAELSHARGFRYNTFKIELAKRTIASVLSELAGAGDKQ